MHIATRFKKTMIQVLLAALLAMPIQMVAAWPAQAETNATITVNSTLDAADANPGDGLCAINATLGGGCTLRAAVQEANARSGADTIVLSAQTYFLSITGLDADANAAAGDLDLTDPAGVTFRGAGAAITANFRVFQVHAGATATIDRVTIRNAPQAILNQGALTFRNGSISGNLRVQANQPRYDVSGIDSRGSLTMANVNLSTLAPGDIGQIALRGNQAAPVNSLLDNVTIQAGQGTAIVVSGSDNVVEIRDTTVDGAPLAAFIDGANQVMIRRSTFSRSRNGALLIGAGAVEFPLSVNLLNSTLSGNQGGAALRLTSSDSRRLALFVNNVTITANSGSGVVGGIHVPALVHNLPSAVTVANSIIAGNTHNSNLLGTENNCAGPLRTLGRNMIQFASADVCIVSGPNTNTAPTLDPLAANGGATQTHALPNGSSAIDAGDVNLPGTGPGTCETEDQTGKVRPQGARCDLGAVEVPGVAGRPFIVTSIAPTSTLAASGPFSLTVNGDGFLQDTVVRLNFNTQLPTTFVNTNQLIAAVPELLYVGEGGLVGISAFDPGLGLSSNGVAFQLFNPQPVLGDLTPQKVRRNLATQIVVTGAGFIPFTTALVNGVEHSTNVINTNELRFEVTPAETQTVGAALQVQIFNPTPGGGSSAETMDLLVVDTPGVGTGTVATNLASTAETSSITLGWVHPVDWRKLTTMSVNIVDGTSNTIVAGFGFVEEYGEKGALVALDDAGNVTGIGFPGEEAQLATPIGLLDLKTSQINATPGTTVEVVYAFQFNGSTAGRTFGLTITARDENGDDHGFEEVGAITVPSSIFLPLLNR
jgi:CSLREA domain-containing protein